MSLSTACWKLSLLASTAALALAALLASDSAGCSCEGRTFAPANISDGAEAAPAPASAAEALIDIEVKMGTLIQATALLI